MKIEVFFDKTTSTLTYVVWDQTTKDAVVIDPVMDYDLSSSTYDYKSVDKITNYLKENDLNLHFIMETHVHADHLTGAQELKKRIPNAKIAIGNQISKVQETFKSFFNLGDEFRTDGSQFDRLLKDNELVEAGSLKFKTLHTPGHTPACCSYLIKDAVFTGDTLFMPDFGVARCDFPGGNSDTLFDSVKNKLYSLPNATRYFTAHDYQPGGRELKYESTIGESKKNNIHLNELTTKDEFVIFRTEKDKTLSAPKLLLPSVEINMDAGRFPGPEENNVSYLKIPLRPKK